MKTVFNVRVYGILIVNHEVLVTDEYRYGKFITKFPGGGLHFGEGTLDCMKREMMEETGSEVEVIRHFYTTDFFQPSAFNETHQLICIYYLIRSLKPLTIEIKKEQFDFDSKTEGAQIFRWLSVSSLKKDDFTFPIDQHIAELLQQANRQ